MEMEADGVVARKDAIVGDMSFVSTLASMSTERAIRCTSPTDTKLVRRSSESLQRSYSIPEMCAHKTLPPAVVGSSSRSKLRLERLMVLNSTSAAVTKERLRPLYQFKAMEKHASLHRLGQSHCRAQKLDKKRSEKTNPSLMHETAHKGRVPMVQHPVVTDAHKQVSDHGDTSDPTNTMENAMSVRRVCVTPHRPASASGNISLRTGQLRPQTSSPQPTACMPKRFEVRGCDLGRPASRGGGFCVQPPRRRPQSAHICMSGSAYSRGLVARAVPTEDTPQPSFGICSDIKQGGQLPREPCGVLTQAVRTNRRWIHSAPARPTLQRRPREYENPPKWTPYLGRPHCSASQSPGGANTMVESTPAPLNSPVGAERVSRLSMSAWRDAQI